MIKIPMARKMLRFCMVLFSSFLVIINASENRQFLPPQTYNCDNGSIVHIQANGNNDTLHRLYSSSGSFVVLTAVTSKKAKLSVNCSNDAGSAIFTENPIYSYALMFTRFYSFFDEDDTADVNKANPQNVTTVPFYQMKWCPAEVHEAENNHSISVVYDLEESGYFTNSTLRIKLTAFHSQDRSSILPHLVHTMNSTQIEVILDNAPITSKKPRFAIQMLLIVKSNDSDFEIDHTRSLDDEFTPGVFKFTQIRSAFARDKKLGSFAQWKPIVYTSVKSARDSTTVTQDKTLKTLNMTNMTESSEIFVNSMANAFFGNELESTSANIINITFGLTGDKFYSNTNYSSWTLSTGYGIPPEDEISTAIIIVLIAGLGIPLLLLIGGGIYVFIKRSRQKDDLLLSD